MWFLCAMTNFSCSWEICDVLWFYPRQMHVTEAETAQKVKRRITPVATSYRSKEIPQSNRLQMMVLFSLCY